MNQRFCEAMNESPGSSSVKKAMNCAAWPEATATEIGRAHV